MRFPVVPEPFPVVPGTTQHPVPFPKGTGAEGTTDWERGNDWRERLAGTTGIADHPEPLTAIPRTLQQALHRGWKIAPAFTFVAELKREARQQVFRSQRGQGPNLQSFLRKVSCLFEQKLVAARIYVEGMQP